MTFIQFWRVLDVLIFSYLFYISIYNFSLSLSALRKRVIDIDDSPLGFHDILILIPCYRDHQVILSTAKRAVEQFYPKDKFQVVVIADTIPKKTISELGKLPLVTYEVSFEKSTKVRALNKALDLINHRFDAVVILDADNLMKEDFLTKFNIQFSSGSKVIQGQRLPKESDSDVAFLDGLSEKINNHIFRKGSNNLGLSSSIAGSAFGVEFQLFKETLREMDSIGGFDKELEILLLEKGYKTEYFQNLVVYEEKVENKSVFQKQRKRWISSQYFYLRKFFIKGLKGLLLGDISYFNSTILRNLQLPRLINLGLLPLFLVYAYLLPEYHLVSENWWLYLIIGYGMSFVFALPKDFYTIKGLKAILKLPELFIVMLKLLFKLKGANKSFIHTPKGIINQK